MRFADGHFLIASLNIRERERDRERKRGREGEKMSFIVSVLITAQ